MTPYYSRGGISLYCGDMKSILPRLDLSEVGCVLADPPYGVTSLKWDVWPDGWPAHVAQNTPDRAVLPGSVG